MLDLFHVDDRRYARFPRMSRERGLVHAFATRPLDVSARVDDRSHERAARRAQMARDLGLDPRQLTHCVQVHDVACHQVRAGEPAGPREACDALITDVADRALMTFSADCPLILVYDPRTPALGMVHASWRCTTAHATRLIVQRMSTAFGSRPGDLLAGIGPGAGPCCYEVRQDVYDAAAGLPDRATLFPQRDGRMYFDLFEANQRELLAAGLCQQNIERADTCTMCRTELFFSFRREGAGCGHFGMMAALRAAAD